MAAVTAQSHYELSDPPTVRQAHQSLLARIAEHGEIALHGVVESHAFGIEGMGLYDTVERDFTVLGGSREQGLVRLPHRWGIG